jgi:hypothetical protein
VTLKCRIRPETSAVRFRNRVYLPGAGSDANSTAGVIRSLRVALEL